MAASDQQRLKRWFGRHPLRTMLRIAATLVGVGVSGWLISIVWPEPDRVARGAPPSVSDPTSLAKFPAMPITLLVIGVDTDNLSDPTNQAAPKGPANADALLLVRIDAKQPLRVLQVPTELAVQLPGSDQPMALGGLWRSGGVSLMADAIREIVGIADTDLQRYVVVPRQTLRTLVDGLGEVDVILSQSYKRTDKSLGYGVDLQAGRQSLNGAQAEQLARLLQNGRDYENRRLRQQMLMRSVVDQLQAPSGIVGIRALLDEVNGQLETNLSYSEMLSLAAALIASPAPVQFSQLPLAPAVGEQTLRQLKPGLPLPLWTTP
ncbi:MAG: LytR family transcriptional regulator [Synechococcus sp. TMED20]|nr:MAG: LytR family transcriptional regulator [Synechococcus sp. TMED20]